MSTIVSTQSPASLNPTRQQLDELEALLKRMLDLPVNQLGEADEGEDADDEPDAPPSLVQPIETKPAMPSVSYMVVETASPRPIPPASGFEPRPSLLAPRLVPVAAPPEKTEEREPAPTEPLASTEPEDSPAEMPATDPTSTEAEVWVPLRSTWQPSAQTWQPLAESWQQANGAAPAPAAMPAAIPAPKPDLIPLIPAASAPVASVQRPAPKTAGQTATGETPVPPAAAPVQPRLSLSAEDAPVSVPSLLLPLVWFNQGFDACLAPLGAPGRWLCGPRARQALGAVGLLSLAAAAILVVSAGMGWTW